MIRVTIWSEFCHKRNNPEIAAIYPDGIHGAITAFLGRVQDFKVHTNTLDEPEHGLSDAVLNNTEVFPLVGAHGTR